ncbi:Hypp6653 [Branchiostoma lanceolatum]|uniref:Hypp6653 protein n=1 Tax=Branchiostoma lanceolatum TaxID=7740 RepID=A0A8J9YVB5_BRALA|nr:Hypp6653 [Branchiostoma lanceolatum]
MPPSPPDHMRSALKPVRFPAEGGSHTAVPRTSFNRSYAFRCYSTATTTTRYFGRCYIPTTTTRYFGRCYIPTTTTRYFGATYQLPPPGMSSGATWKQPPPPPGTSAGATYQLPPPGMSSGATWKQPPPPAPQTGSGPVPATPLHLKTHLPAHFLGKGEEDFHVWLGKFEVYADAHQYTPDVRARILPTFLDGPALTYFQSLQQDIRRDYTNLLGMLSHAFSQDRFTFSFQQSLAQRKRQPGESFIVFAAELEELVRRAYATTHQNASKRYNEPAIKGVALQYFTQGIDAATRLRVMERNPATIEEAAEIATLYEQAVAASAPRETREQPVNAVQRDDLHTAVATLTEQVSILTNLFRSQHLSSAPRPYYEARAGSTSPFRQSPANRSRSPYRNGSFASSRSRSPYRGTTDTRARSPSHPSDNVRPNSPYRHSTDSGSRSPYRQPSSDRPNSPYRHSTGSRSRSPYHQSSSDRPNSPYRHSTDSRSRSPYRQPSSDRNHSRSPSRSVRFADQGNDLPLMPRAGHQ